MARDEDYYLETSRLAGNVRLEALRRGHSASVAERAALVACSLRADDMAVDTDYCVDVAVGAERAGNPGYRPTLAQAIKHARIHDVVCHVIKQGG